MSADETEFDAAGRAAIVAEWKRLAAEPPPTNPRPYGCATFLIAAALLPVLPKVIGLMGISLPPPLGAILFVVLTLALAGGFVVGVFFGSGVYGRAAARSGAALEWLAANPDAPDAEARRSNAVAVVYYAVVWDGPTVSMAFDSAAARARLGASLGYVLAVERVLVEELKVQPIFRIPSTT